MWPRADDAHVAFEHIPELRNLVDAQFAQPFADRINAIITVTRLPRHVVVVRPHRAKFVDLELPVLHAGPPLHMEKRSWGLESMGQKYDHRQDWKHHQHYRNGDREIDSAFAKTIERIFERFLA